MAELVCSECYKTYYPDHGHLCVDNWWIPGVANRSIPIQKVAIWLEESSSKLNEHYNEQTSASTELLNKRFSSYIGLSNQVIRDNGNPTHTNQDGTIGVISHGSAIPGKCSGVPVMEEDLSRRKHSYIRGKTSGSALIPEEIQSAAMNPQSSNNRRSQEQNQRIDQSGNKPVDFGINEAERFQPSMTSNKNSVKTIYNPVAYIGLLSNQMPLDSSIVRNMPGKPNTSAAEYALGLNKTDSVRSQEKSVNKETFSERNPALTSSCSENNHHTVSGHCRVHFIERNCPFSSKGFSSDNHPSWVTSISDAFQKVIPQNFELMKHMLKEEKKPYVCSVCTKAFKRKHQLDTHMFTHKPQKTAFKCKFCDKAYTSEKDFKTHVRFHTIENPYKCYICGKFFSSKDILNEHKRSHVKELTCSICRKVFTYKTSLSKHMLRHKGIEPFKCVWKIIQPQVRFKQSLFNVGVKPHLCEFCGRRFTHKCNFNKHKMTHESKTRIMTE